MTKYEITQFNAHHQHSLWFNISSGQKAAIRMAKCSLNEKLEERIICTGLVANMPMATSAKKGGNTE
jgi:hypothetical protein